VNPSRYCTATTAKQQATVQEQIEQTLESLSVTPRQGTVVTNLLNNHATVFSDIPGRVNNYVHKLDITDATPFSQKSYPIPILKRPVVDAQIKKMLEWGFIDTALSAYTNPLVTVVKPNGSVRVCLDARYLNTRVQPQHDTPLPMEEILQQFYGMKYFTTLELTNSFWQMPLRTEDQQYTAFVHNGVTYKYCVVPFGLQSSVAGLTRCLNKVITPAMKHFVTVYVDKLLIASRTVEEHVIHVDQVLTHLAEVNLTVKFEKYQFF
jgi:Reverse transcriptase (RNA-dependent DNA polymerase)